jgi:hypothetical protein
MSKKKDVTVSLKLSESNTLRLIQLYQSGPCLYDVNSDDYRNRELRVAATKRIAAALSVDGFGPKEVATKLKNLRKAELSRSCSVDVLISSKRSSVHIEKRE